MARITRGFRGRGGRRVIPAAPRQYGAGGAWPVLTAESILPWATMAMRSQRAAVAGRWARRVMVRLA